MHEKRGRREGKQKRKHGSGGDKKTLFEEKPSKEG